VSKSEIIASLDIGTSTIHCLIGELKRPKGDINILGIGSSTSTGLKKGVVIDIDSTVRSIVAAKESAERMANLRIDSVYINIPGGLVTLLNNKGIVAISREDREIGQGDIDRVIQAAKVLAIPADREIIDIIPKEYVVDGYDGVKDPMGMVGFRLEVNAQLVTCQTTSVQNLIRSVKKAGLEVRGIVIEPLASAEVVLNSDEKELGAVLIDVGGTITEYSVFHQGNLVHCGLIPVGGDHITNDITIGLRIPANQGERIKRELGTALVSKAKESEVFEVSSVGKNEIKKISQLELAKIIEPRVQEIFSLVKKNIAHLEAGGINPSVAVITGGGVTHLPVCAEAASFQLEIPARIGIPQVVGVNQPDYTVALGILKYINNLKSFSPAKERAKHSSIPNIIETIKNWIKEYF
jgi:cell division protein FtsA